MNRDDCVFCRIAAGQLNADIVYRGDHVVAFLDNKPLFPGHVLVCPRQHYETLIDLPMRLTEPVFEAAKLVANAVESAMDAEGTFVAINNRVSQTVPHLHVHVVPRRRRDGLRGFFWPRNDYIDDAAREAVRHAIEREIDKLIRHDAEARI